MSGRTATSDNLKPLTTTDEVIEALGGVQEVMELTGVKHNQSLWYQRTRGWFASKYYLVMTNRLNELGYSAPGELWSQYAADRSSGVDAA